MKRHFLRSAAVTTILCFCFAAESPAHAASSSNNRTSDAQITNSAAAQKKADFWRFKPRPSNNKALDYAVWSQLLEGSVVNVGPSTRERPQKSTYQQPGKDYVSSSVGGGTKIKRGVGHTSAYRLEGNKVIFSEFSPAWRKAIHQYRLDLEQTGNEVGLTRLPRNEQLAFWLNLHNAVIIDTMSQNYPFKRPEDLMLKSTGEPLHDAKLVTINGQALSLRDIRENIVYRYWNNPAVIYGFFHGDLSSPSIRKDAFTGQSVAKQLGENGVQFVNSLRGTHPWRGSDMRVAKLYVDVAPWFFKNFDRDLKAHLLRFGSDAVKGEIEAETTFTPNIHQPTIADLIAGEPLMSRDTTRLRKEGIPYSNRKQVERFAYELERKFIVLKDQGKIGQGTVTIEDIPTEDLSASDK